MLRLKVGDPVRIVSRETTSEDAKTGLFYGHFRGLDGTVLNVFKSGEAAVQIEPESLPEDVWVRHMSARDQMRDRWLEGLAPEQRRRLKPDHKQLELRYVVLVSITDLERRRVRPNRTVV